MSARNSSKTTVSSKDRHKLQRRVLDTPSVFEAAWEGAFEGYTAKYINANLWRVARTCDFEDAMQEARIVFLRCARKYADKVDNAAWFMAVYKRSLAGRFADLSTNDTRYRAVGELCGVDDDGAQYTLDGVGELANEGELRCLINEAPGEVREVLALLLGAPTEILELATAAWRAGGKRAPFENTMINRMLGRDVSRESLEAVFDYFS